MATISERVAAAAGQPVSGNVPIPELGLTAMLHRAGPFSEPRMRVTYESLLTPEEWDYHWSIAALQIKDSIEKKDRKTYGLPSIVVLDASRLGSAGQMPTGSWTGKFQEVLDTCKLGNLGGALVVRSELTSEVLEPPGGEPSSHRRTAGIRMPPRDPMPSVVIRDDLALEQGSLHLSPLE